MSKNPNTNNTLQQAKTLLNMGKPQQAAAACQKLIKKNPRNTEALTLLGIIASQNNNYALAENYFRKIVNVLPNEAMSHYNLAKAFYLQEKYKQAGDSYKKSIDLNPNIAETHYNLGNTYVELGGLDHACASYQQAISLNTGHINALNNLGLAYEQQAKADDAIKTYKRAINITPDIDYLHNNLGNAYSSLGDFTSAEACYRRAISLNPHHVESLCSLTKIKKNTSHNDQIKVMKSLCQSANVSEEEKIKLNFGLGKVYEDLKQYDTAFNYFSAGNDIKKTREKFDILEVKKYFNQIKSNFFPNLFSQFKEAGNPDPTPIFILGMPRSGSTLIEQILSSHPNVFGAGELKLLHRLVFNEQPPQATSSYPENLPSANQNYFGQLGAAYISGLKKLNNNKSYITDKMPHNFTLIGLIKLILPNATIIHSKRNPVDTCLSCFKQDFADTIAYTNDLQDLGEYYLLYEELMSFWHDALPGFIYDVQYEDLVKDPERVIRNLLDTCHLPWDGSCLNFYNSKQPVLTNSVAQVRKPLYSGSIGSWKLYEKNLTPLLDTFTVKHRTD